MSLHSVVTQVSVDVSDDDACSFTFARPYLCFVVYCRVFASLCKFRAALVREGKKKPGLFTFPSRDGVF